MAKTKPRPVCSRQRLARSYTPKASPGKINARAPPASIHESPDQRSRIQIAGAGHARHALYAFLHADTFDTFLPAYLARAMMLNAKKAKGKRLSVVRCPLSVACAAPIWSPEDQMFSLQ